MSKMSRSPERYTFQKNSHIKRQKEKGESVLREYVDLFDALVEDDKQKEHDTEWQKNNLEWDLRTADWILEKVRISDSYAQNLYAAMCNNSFQKLDVMPILKEERWHCSWRYAGGIIADMREKGDYIDWYCSGMGKNDEGFVPESAVTDEIRQDLKKLGWVVIEDQS
jgi:hypothetical protein